jgi:hypothetical protein
MPDSFRLLVAAIPAQRLIMGGTVGREQYPGRGSDDPGQHRGQAELKRALRSSCLSGCLLESPIQLRTGMLRRIFRIKTAADMGGQPDELLRYAEQFKALGGVR